MKAFGIIAKIVVALAAIAGIVYVVATYGDKIVAWAKGLMNRCKCGCDGDCDECECEGDCEECDCECCCCEEAEEAEEAAEDVAEEVVANEADFAE